MTAGTILVVEDEESYVEALRIGLEREGYRVAVALDGVTALDEFDRVHPDLVLLDLMLPRLSGIEVCRQLRARSGVPIIMVTARDAEVDTVVGLEVGADDYVTKPYRVRELVARIRAVLRRANAGLLDDGDEVVVAGDVRLDRERHEVTVRGRIVDMPRREFEVLDLLMTNTGRLVTRDTLIDRVWGTDYVGDTKTLDVHIRRLRSRIEVDPSAPDHIVTIRGLGYRFEAPSAARPS
jgi:two-component system response regulator RegX3